MRRDFALLVLRVVVGLAMVAQHGLPKLMGYSEKAALFSDPLGVGSAASLSLAIFAEFFCSIGIMLGALTRLAAFPLFITMAVAFFVVHGADPFAKKELSLLYMVSYLTLLLSGPGALSLDQAVFGKKKNPFSRFLLS